eukprot:Rhum_TRINITY_DN15473_c3_g1::Rhum_TRINITY_DN15473_c3_g1_i2::g.158340::m.158340
MEILCRDGVSGATEVLEVKCETASQLLTEVCELFGREEEDMALEVDGEEVWVSGWDAAEVAVSSLSLRDVVLRRSLESLTTEKIKVLVRVRPLSRRELDAGMKQAVDVDLKEDSVTVNHEFGAPERWTFDAVLNNSYSQKDIFVTFIQPMVDSVMEGFNATIFAYGGYGTGKTYTMSGIQNSEMDLSGIIPRSFTYIFNHIKERRNPNISYSLRCS